MDSSTMFKRANLYAVDSLANVKDTLSDLRHFLSTETPLRIMKNEKNTFYFTLKAIFILKIFENILVI